MTCGFLVDHITFLQLPRLAQAGPPQSYTCRVVIETRGFLGPESNQSRWQFTFQWNQEGQSHVYQRMNGANHLDICRWIARLYRKYVFSFRLRLFMAHNSQMWFLHQLTFLYMAPILYFPHFGRRLFCTRSRSEQTEIQVAPRKNTNSFIFGGSMKLELSSQVRPSMSSCYEFRPIHRFWLCG
jgi:hypothetical protein